MGDVINFPGSEDGHMPPPECERCGGKLEPWPNMVMHCRECEMAADVMWMPVAKVKWEGK